MFHSFSWQQYSNAVLFLLAGYYAVIGWVFFRHKLKTAGSIFRPSATAARGEYAPALDLLTGVQESMAAMGALLDTAAARKYQQEELLMAIKTILSRYPLIKASFFETSINQWIMDRAAAACGMHLSAADLQRCW